jgi:VWFA-related protein
MGGRLAWRPSALTALTQEPVVRLEPAAASVPGGPDGTIRVNSDLVLIPVLVTDHNDRAITGLERAHFRLWEDKTEQAITHFAAEDAPVSVVFAFDVSGSMSRRLKLAREAVDQFLKGANPEDEFALVAFNEEAQLLQSFTSNPQDIQNRMFLLQAKGRTALLDAILVAMDETKYANNKRKVILVVSDGGDNCSRNSFREVRSRVREADVQIYSIGIEDLLWLRTPSAEQMQGAALLSDIASQTGGRLYEIDNADELPDTAAKIGRALRNQYLLGYVPASHKRDGKYHRIQVKVLRSQGQPRLRTSFRAGYIAPSN